MDKIPSPCFPGLPRADPSELSFIQPIGGLSHAIGITAFVLFNLDLVPMEKISALSLMHFVRNIIHNSNSEDEVVLTKPEVPEAHGEENFPRYSQDGWRLFQIFLLVKMFLV